MAQATMPKRATWTVEEMAALLGLGRGAAYRAVAAGDIRSIRVGNRLLIPRSVVDQLLSPEM